MSYDGKEKLLENQHQSKEKSRNSSDSGSAYFHRRSPSQRPVYSFREKLAMDLKFGEENKSDSNVSDPNAQCKETNTK